MADFSTSACDNLRQDSGVMEEENFKRKQWQIQESISDRNKVVGRRILWANLISAYIALSMVFAVPLIVALIEFTGSSTPPVATNSAIWTRIWELGLQWGYEIRNSGLGSGQMMNLTAITAALVLAVALRSQGKSGGTVDEESRFIWLKHLTLASSLIGGVIGWILTFTRDWTQLDQYLEALILTFLTTITASLAAVIGGNTFLLSKEKARLDGQRIISSRKRDTVAEKSTESISGKSRAMVMWWTFGIGVPLGATFGISLWGGINSNISDWWVAPACVALWCFCVAGYQVQFSDLSKTGWKSTLTHVAAGGMAAIVPIIITFIAFFYTFGNIVFSLFIVFVIYSLPWLMFKISNRSYAIFSTSRLKIIDKEISRIEQDIKKVEGDIEAHTSRIAQ